MPRRQQGWAIELPRTSELPGCQVCQKVSRDATEVSSPPGHSGCPITHSTESLLGELFHCSWARLVKSGRHAQSACMHAPLQVVSLLRRLRWPGLASLGDACGVCGCASPRGGALVADGGAGTPSAALFICTRQFESPPPPPSRGHNLVRRTSILRRTSGSRPTRNRLRIDNQEAPYIPPDAILFVFLGQAPHALLGAALADQFGPSAVANVGGPHGTGRIGSCDA